MSTLLDRRTPPADAPPRPAPSDVLPLLPAALRAAVGSLLLVVGGAVLAWTAAAQTTAPLSSAVRVAADLWLLAHGTGITVTGGRVEVVPLGLTALAAVTAVRQVRRWAEEQVAAERALPWGWAAAVFATGYAAVAAVVALVSGMPSAVADVSVAPLGGALLGAAVVLGCGVRWAGLGAGVVPGRLRRCLRPAATALAALLGSGALLVAGALVAAHESVLLLHGSLAPGVVGGLLLTLAQVLLLPVFVVWALAWLAGTGFAVGVGTTVTPAAAEVGALPALPVLGALPAPGPLPVLTWAVLSVPVLAGAAAALLQRRREAEPTDARERLATAAGTGTLVAVAVGVLCWAAGGAAGPGRMAEVGPPPLLTAAAVGAEVAVGMLLLAALSTAASSLLPGRALRVPHRLDRSWPAGLLSGRPGRAQQEPAAGEPAAGEQVAGERVALVHRLGAGAARVRAAVTRRGPRRTS